MALHGSPPGQRRRAVCTARAVLRSQGATPTSSRQELRDDMLELKSLKCFVVLAEELHFGRAADRLHISQPPLSLKIRALEAELGLQLFQRSSRRVELTHSGQILLIEARRVLRDAEQLSRLATSLALGEAGTLAIGFNALLAYRLMPQLVTEFSERHPQVKVTLNEMVSSEQVDALLEHQIDVGLLRPPLPPGFRSLSLGSEEIVVFLPAKHPLAAQESIPLAALAGEPMLMFSQGESSYLHNLTMQMCIEAGFAPLVRQETRHIHAIVALVGTGMGVALLPASAGFIHMDGIAIRRLQDTGAHGGTRRAHTVMATLETNANPAVQLFLAFVQKAAPTVDNVELAFGAMP